MKSLKELFLLIGLAFLVRLPWLLMVPQVEAPDENSHFWVIEFICRHFSLPDFQSVMTAGSQAVYGSIPQFGYLPHVLFLKCLESLAAPEHAIYLARLGSLSMGLIVVGVAYFIGKLLFLPNHIAALALPLMIIFHPQFVFVTSYINNDSTTAALAALILWLLIIAIKRGLNLPLVLSLSICFSILILAKYSGYCVLLTGALFLPLIIYLHKRRAKQQFILLLYIVAITLILTVWWFVRNYFLFVGDVTGVKTMNNIWQLTYHKQMLGFNSPWAVLVNHQFWRMLFFSFWGWFGYMTRSLPRALYYGYLGFVIISAVQFLRTILRKIQHKIRYKAWHGMVSGEQAGQFNWWTGLEARFTVAGESNSLQTTIGSSGIAWIRSWTWLVLLSCFIFNFMSCIYGCYCGVTGPQGRYLFPSEIPIMALLIAGLISRRDKVSEVFVIALLAFDFAVYCYSSFFLYQLYVHR